MLKVHCSCCPEIFPKETRIPSLKIIGQGKRKYSGKTDIKWIGLQLTRVSSSSPVTACGDHVLMIVKWGGSDIKDFEVANPLVRHMQLSNAFWRGNVWQPRTEKASSEDHVLRFGSTLSRQIGSQGVAWWGECRQSIAEVWQIWPKPNRWKGRIKVTSKNLMNRHVA